jgi:glycosyltransferase involved in cell wall biosynthesis
MTAAYGNQNWTPSMTSAVCLIAKDEERAIAEWLAYQLIIGFDRIYVYDNDSTDRTPAIVQQIAHFESAIDYRHWPNVPDRRPQISAYADALENADTDWLAFFDTDEFLVLHKHASVGAFLASMPPDVSAIAVNWLLFGSNDRNEAGSGLVIERFTKCAVNNYGKNFFCKSIVRPRSVCQMAVHTATLSRGHYANASGQRIDIEPAKTPRVSFEVAQLNHYLLKSREEFLLKKARGHAARALNDVAKDHISLSAEYWDAHDANHRDNLQMLRYQVAISQRLATWGMSG